jgi:hypothetical protein
MGRMQVRPVSPPRLVEEVADRIAGHITDHIAGPEPGGRLRVAVDGAEAADPDALAASLVDPLRVRGRAALHVRAGDFLRPASERFEHGRKNPEAFYQRWLDEEGLRREVLDRAGSGGSGQVLPTLWDPLHDRATRAEYVTVPPGGVVLVSGPLLLGGELPFEFVVHLWLSAAALERRTTEPRQWTLPAYARYEAEVSPTGLADVVVRADDPERPAVVDAW